VSSPSPGLTQGVRRVVAAAWQARYRIEVESELRFSALAQRLADAQMPAELVDRARTASSDETRHAAECVQYVKRYAPDAELPPPPPKAREFAPGFLNPLQRLTYEMVTTCCVAETHSATNLVALFNAGPPEPLLSSLQALSRDEVTHGQLGWAFLEVARTRLSLDFLVPLLGGMLAADAGQALMTPANPDEDDPVLLQHGVLPHSARRELFTATLNEVIYPGFERAGVSTTDARAWVQERL